MSGKALIIDMCCIEDVGFARVGLSGHGERAHAVARSVSCRRDLRESHHRRGVAPEACHVCGVLLLGHLRLGIAAEAAIDSARPAGDCAELVGSLQVDFVVMGIAGNDDKTIGSETESVTPGARCTTFAIKNPFR